MTVSTDYPRTLDLALAATRAGHLDEADKLLREASRLQPAEALPHFLLGANAAEAGRNDAAESEYIACLSRAPGMAIARFQLGLLQVTNGRPAAGAATWEPLFLLDEREPLRHFAAGLVAIVRGDADAGRRSIETGIALNTDNPALNKDMQGVLARVAALPRVTDDAQTEAPAGADHVLLSAYRQS